MNEPTYNLQYLERTADVYLNDKSVSIVAYKREPRSHDLGALVADLVQDQKRFWETKGFEAKDAEYTRYETMIKSLNIHHTKAYHGDDEYQGSVKVKARDTIPNNRWRRVGDEIKHTGRVDIYYNFKDEDFADEMRAQYVKHLKQDHPLITIKDVRSQITIF